MTSKEQLINDISETFKQCIQIIEKKNNDYAGKDTVDAYKNFRGSTFIDVTVEHGILVRIMDKIVRVKNLLSQTAAVSNESLEDSINDAINYLAILKSFIKNDGDATKN